jgi:hypothetical protein
VGIFDDIADIAEDAVDVVTSAPAAIVDAVAEIPAAVVDVVETVVEEVVDPAVQAVRDALEAGLTQLPVLPGSSTGSSGGFIQMFPVVTDVFDTVVDAAEGVGVAVDAAASAAASAAGTAVEATVDIAETVGAAAVDAGEAAVTTGIEVGTEVYATGTEIAATAASLPGEAVGAVVDAGRDVVAPVLDPIVGKGTLDDIAEAAKVVGTAAVGGGAVGVADVIQDRVATEAGNAVRDVAGDELGTAADIAVRRGQGDDIVQAARGAGVDPTEAVGQVAEEAARPIIGEDGAAAAGRLGRAVTDAYGDEAAAAANDGGMSNYGSRGATLDPSAPTTSGTVGASMTTRYESTREQEQEITAAAKDASGEVLEAVAEPIVGQEAAEVIGKYGPEIGYEVLRTTLSGGTSAAQAGVNAFRQGYQMATGEPFEQAIGAGIADELRPLLGDGADIVGRGLGLGLQVGLDAAVSGEAPDLDDLDAPDIDQLKAAGLALLNDEVRDLTGLDPDALVTFTDHLSNGTLTEEDVGTLLDVTKRLAPDEAAPFIDAGRAFYEGDPDAALESLVPALPQELQDAYAAGQSITDLAAPPEDVPDTPFAHAIDGADQIEHGFDSLFDDLLDGDAPPLVDVQSLVDPDDGLDDPLDDGVGDAVGIALGDALGDALDDDLGDGLGDALDDGLRDALLDGLGDLDDALGDLDDDLDDFGVATDDVDAEPPVVAHELDADTADGLDAVGVDGAHDALTAWDDDSIVDELFAPLDDAGLDD